MVPPTNDRIGPQWPLRYPFLAWGADFVQVSYLELFIGYERNLKRKFISSQKIEYSIYNLCFICLRLYIL